MREKRKSRADNGATQNLKTDVQARRLPLPQIQNFIAMRPTVENIKMMLGESVSVEVPTAGFHFSELLELT